MLVSATINVKAEGQQGGKVWSKVKLDVLGDEEVDDWPARGAVLELDHLNVHQAWGGDVVISPGHGSDGSGGQGSGLPVDPYLAQTSAPHVNIIRVSRLLPIDRN